MFAGYETQIDALSMLGMAAFSLFIIIGLYRWGEPWNK